MRSYLSLIPISARVHRRQNRMTLLCIIFAVFMVTAIFSMAEMGARMEQSRLSDKHGEFSLINSLMDTAMGQTLMVTAAGMFLLVLIAGVLMISSSINSSVVQRTQFFGMMRCIGMSKQQIIRFVRLEALNWCKTAVPIGLGIMCCSTISCWGRIFKHSAVWDQWHWNCQRYFGGCDYGPVGGENPSQTRCKGFPRCGGFWKFRKNKNRSSRCPFSFSQD